MVIAPSADVVVENRRQGVRTDNDTGSERKWKGWETVCSFPVLFSVSDHYMAARFLLATHAVPPDGSEPTDRAKKQFSEDLREYRDVCSTGRLDSRCGRILQSFELRKRAWLKKYGFKTPDRSTYTCSLMAVRFINRRLDNWLERFGDEHHGEIVRSDGPRAPTASSGLCGGRRPQSASHAHATMSTEPDGNSDRK